MVELVHAGRDPEDLAREFEPTAQSIRNWVAQADCGEGCRTDKEPGISSAERAELIRRRRAVRRLRLERDILSKAAAGSASPTFPPAMVRPREGHDTVRVCRFMSLNQASFPSGALARVLGVSAAGYAAWQDRLPSAQARAAAALVPRIRTIHASSRQTYGAPRVHAQLRSEGAGHGRKRIARLRREAGLIGASPRQGGPPTTQCDDCARPAPDLVDRDFTAAAASRLWVADLTFVRKRPVSRAGGYDQAAAR